MEKLLNKVPEITLFFWIIKIACTTVGETAADYLTFNLQFGINITTIIMSILLLIILFIQIKKNKYVPSIYRISIVIISIVGTLITDNMTDNLGISLYISSTIFSIALAITFILWYRSEKTLSIHSIFTRKRELYYRTTILFTFALGTALGDLLAEIMRLGYANSIFLFGAIIAFITILQFRFQKYSILTFWIIYILTRPLGASIGDYLSQNINNGGLGLGTTQISLYLLIIIVVLVSYLTISKKDVIK